MRLKPMPTSAIVMGIIGLGCKIATIFVKGKAAKNECHARAAWWIALSAVAMALEG